jgi:hypothetical protein
MDLYQNLSYRDISKLISRACPTARQLKEHEKLPQRMRFCTFNSASKNIVNSCAEVFY